jgi:hypothetical protein
MEVMHHLHTYSACILANGTRALNIDAVVSQACVCPFSYEQCVRHNEVMWGVIYNVHLKLVY